MSRNIVAEQEVDPLLRAVIGTAVCISVAMASIVPTPLLKPREYGLLGWADQLTLTSINRSMTFDKAGSSEMGLRFVFLWDQYNLGYFPSSDQSPL